MDVEKTVPDPAQHGHERVRIPLAVGLLSAFLVVGIGIILYALISERHEPGVRLSACAVRMNTAAEVLFRYADQHGGQFPPNRRTLILELDARGLRCGAADKAGQTAYFHYVAGQSRSSNPDNLLLYDVPEFHKGQRILVLRVSGKEAALTEDELLAAIRQTNADLRQAATRPAPATAPDPDAGATSSF